MESTGNIGNAVIKYQSLEGQDLWRAHWTMSLMHHTQVPGGMLIRLFIIGELVPGAAPPHWDAANRPEASS